MHTNSSKKRNKTKYTRKWGGAERNNNMTKHSIYCSDESRPLDEALKIITDEWVDDGSYCAQTVIDLRDALKFYIKECKKLEKQINNEC